MRRRVSRPDDAAKPTLSITPLIDVVFLLLIFFVMTFRIVAQEGDFPIKTPRAPAVESELQEVALPALRLRLRANPDGRLSEIRLNDVPYGSWEQMQGRIISLLRQSPSMRENAELVLECDDNLDYQHVIDAITAVSGYVDRDDSSKRIIKLISKINLR